MQCLVFIKPNIFNRNCHFVYEYGTKCCGITFLFYIYIYQTLLSKATYNCIQVIHFH